MSISMPTFLAQEIQTRVSGNFQGQATPTTGAQRIALTEPEALDLTRSGRRFGIGYTAAPTGIAPVQALVTTAAQWTIFNGDTAKTYFFDTLGVHLASGTAGAGIVVVACFFTTPVQTGLATGVAIQNRSNSNRASSAAVKSGVTITAPSAPAWFTVAENINANTAVLNTEAVNRSLKGSIALQPNQGLGIAVYSPTGTSPLFVPVAEWYELETSMG